MRHTLIFILGPTSSGKSAVAAEVAARAGGEVISCDSMQVYRDMDVLTRVPSEETLSKAPHHLIKIIPPEEEFNAALFVEKTVPLIRSIISRNKVPVLAGGTGLYVKALVDGIFDSPHKDNELREELTRICAEKGNEYLYAELEKIDPAAAAKIHPNDRRRIIRAIEVYNMTGRTITDRKKESRGISEEYDCRMFGLDLDRARLYERINSSVDEMFAKGAVEEVKRLLGREAVGAHCNVPLLTASRAIGVAEITDLLRGRITPEEAKEEIRKNTRQYAKRQLTWFRADKRIIWLNADRDVNGIVDEIASSLRSSQ